MTEVVDGGGGTQLATTTTRVCDGSVLHPVEDEDVLVGVVTVRMSSGVEVEDVDVERWLPGGESGGDSALAWIFGRVGDNNDNRVSAAAAAAAASSSSSLYDDEKSTTFSPPPSTPFAYILTLGWANEKTTISVLSVHHTVEYHNTVFFFFPNIIK